MGIAGWLEGQIQTKLDLAWAQLDPIMTGCGLVFGAGVGLYFVMVLLSYMWTGDAAKLPVFDLFKRFFFLVLVCAFSLSAPFYIEFVKEPILLIPDDISNLITGSTDTTSTAIDNVLVKNFSMIGAVWEPIVKAGIFDLEVMPIVSAALSTIIIFFLGTIFVVIAFSYLMVAKILINVVLLIGPIFIMFSFFGPTREYFMKWVGALLNYIFLVVIFSAVFTLLYALLTSVDPASMQGDFDIVQGLETIANVFILLFIYLLFIAVIMAVPSLASSLTGGVGISPFGQVSQLASALSKIPLPKLPLPKLPGIGKG